ncbi:ABC transporter permease subunit [Streptomyces sp. SID8379]|uniref:carbohydrate ABC transporter permease n=1 Tax=unclassified Streptomyces TaxID=2593676 RepID=UPI00035F4B20|nr:MULTISPECIES: sugar ABC transporter permease [unclassified Streptomyces]MYW65889.1 ABC transporter permease subunit [Streptomyces sp. SID8379]
MAGTTTTDAAIPRARRADTPSDPRAKRRRTRANDRSAYVFLTPWMLGAVVLTIAPMLFSLYMSFTDYNLFDAPHWIGFDNYRRLLLDDPEVRDTVGVTLLYVVVATPLKLIAALGVALLLHTRRKGRNFYRAAFYMPSLIGASVGAAIVWRLLFSTGSVVDRFLGAFGIHTGGWISNPDWSLMSLVALSVWQFGAPMVIFLAALQQIPHDLYEAAELDGAGPVRRFTAVTVPMLSPVIFFNLVLEMVHAFQMFNSAFVLSNGTGGPAGSTHVYSMYLYELGFNDFRMGYAAALTWVLLLVVGVVTAVLFKTSGRWVHYAGEEN